MIEDVVGEREFVGGSGDGDEVREAQQRDQHQHGLRSLPVLRAEDPIKFSFYVTILSEVIILHFK